MLIPKLQKCKTSSNDELFIECDKGAEIVGTFGRNHIPCTTDVVPDSIAKAISQSDVLHSLLCFETLNVLAESSERYG